MAQTPNQLLQVLETLKNVSSLSYYFSSMKFVKHYIIIQNIIYAAIKK